MVRDLIYESLKIFGYDVIEAENGKKALQVCIKDSEKPIHLLITDVIMPDMGGSELAKKLEKLKPDIKVLYMSGYTDNAIVHHGVLDEGVLFLQKPFSPQALARKVREILDTEAEFSHSLCPGYVKKYYPEYNNKVVSNGKNKSVK